MDLDTLKRCSSVFETKARDRTSRKRIPQLQSVVREYAWGCISAGSNLSACDVSTHDKFNIMLGDPEDLRDNLEILFQRKTMLLKWQHVDE